jgi:acetyl-CoA carboxylase beta subunit
VTAGARVSARELFALVLDEGSFESWDDAPIAVAAARADPE